MPYTKGPGGALKWVNPGQGPQIQGREDLASTYNVRTNPQSGHQTSQSQYVDTINQAVPVEQGNTGLPYASPTTGHISKLDTSNIDFGDADQVRQFQESLINSGDLSPTFIDQYGVEQDSMDGIWGKHTQAAYQKAINTKREGQGLLGYEYDKADAPISDIPISDGQGAPDGQGDNFNEDYNFYDTPLGERVSNFTEGVSDATEGVKNWWDNSVLNPWRQ